MFCDFYFYFCKLIRKLLGGKYRGIVVRMEMGRFGKGGLGGRGCRRLGVLFYLFLCGYFLNICYVLV